MSAGAPPCAHGDAFRHSALFYETDDAFLWGTLAFLRDGIEAGEPALVVVDPRKIELLRAELNGEADHVSFLDMEEVGRNPARIIPLWREFADEAARSGVGARGVGEPIWTTRSAAELAECQRHESLLNFAFDDGDAWSLLCPYDSSALPDDVLDEARRSHPVLSDGHGEHASATYDSAATPFDGSLPEPQGRVTELRYGVADVADVRAFVGRYAVDAGLETVSAENLVIAVSELATNSVRHATGAGTVSLWTEESTLLCEIRDGGMIEDPLVGRVEPPLDALSGRGVWIVNQLCDLVQVRSSRRGTAVRIHMDRP